MPVIVAVGCETVWTVTLVVAVPPGPVHERYSVRFFRPTVMKSDAVRGNEPLVAGVCHTIGNLTGYILSGGKLEQVVALVLDQLIVVD